MRTQQRGTSTCGRLTFPDVSYSCLTRCCVHVVCLHRDIGTLESFFLWRRGLCMTAWPSWSSFINSSKSPGTIAAPPIRKKTAQANKKKNQMWCASTHGWLLIWWRFGNNFHSMPVCRLDGQQHRRSTLISSMEPLVVSCFPRGLISLNTSVSYLIEPLPASTDAQQHAVFRAESLHLPRGSCPHHHGNREDEEGLNDFIHGMMSPQSGRVSSDYDPPAWHPLQVWHKAVTTHSVLKYCVSVCRKKGTWARIWSM